jgi:energy-converting hydrogenase Eha subunit A
MSINQIGEILNHIFLIILAIIPPFYFSRKVFEENGRQRTWFVAIFLLSLFVLIGVNAIIINLLGARITEINYLVIFGIESSFCFTLYISDVIKNKKNVLVTSFFKMPTKKELPSVIVFTLFILVALYSLVGYEKKDGYTEFYFYIERNSQPIWQTSFSYSDPIIVKLSIICEEINSTGYSIIAYQDDKKFYQLENIRLEPGSDMTYSVSLPSNINPIVNYKFILLKNDNITPYITLNIWIHRK